MSLRLLLRGKHPKCIKIVGNNFFTFPGRSILICFYGLQVPKQALLPDQAGRFFHCCCFRFLGFALARRAWAARRT